jgi:DNA-binding XRE family transcriptional regulator
VLFSLWLPVFAVRQVWYHDASSQGVPDALLLEHDNTTVFPTSQICNRYMGSRPERVVHRLGAKIRELRIRRGMTTRALADVLNIGHGSVSEIENDKRQPGVDLVRKAAAFFDVSADVLLDDERDV